MINFLNCYHKKVTNYIFDIVICSWLLALVLVINYFHFSLHFHGLDLEKFEFGLIVVFFLLRKVKFTILIFVTFVSPFLDHILHGHAFVIVPFEAFFNFLILLVIYFWSKIFLFSFSSKWSEFSFLFFSLISILFLKIFYFAIVFFLFINNTNFFYSEQWKLNWNNSNQFFLLLFFLLLTFFKFSFLLFFVLLSRKKIK